ERLTAISKEMTANLQAWEKAQKEYKAVFDHIEGIKKRLVDLCVGGDQARDPFAVRLCVGAGWDGQKKEFVGLTDLPPPGQSGPVSDRDRGRGRRRCGTGRAGVSPRCRARRIGAGPWPRTTQSSPPRLCRAGRRRRRSPRDRGARACAPSR